jgi:hypothetical protein
MGEADILSTNKRRPPLKGALMIKVVDGRPGMSSVQLMLANQEEIAVIDPDFC